MVRHETFSILNSFVKVVGVRGHMMIEEFRVLFLSRLSECRNKVLGNEAEILLLSNKSA